MAVTELKGKISSIAKSLEDKLLLTFEIEGKPEVGELRGDTELSIVVRKWRKKRSLDANAYLWVLIGKLSESLCISKLEVYKKAIREIGVHRNIEICNEAIDTLVYSWGLQGMGWFAEKIDESKHQGFAVMALYYGSSCYNTKQMSRLIDYVVQDCRAVGIETMTPAELSILKENWKGQ